MSIETPAGEARPRTRADARNLAGQRMGRKGRDTRARILAAATELLAGPAEVPLSLSAVARQASLSMTTLYLYFGDMTALTLALLVPTMAEAEEAYLRHLRAPWGDEALGSHCQRFVTAFHGFWHRNAAVLHLRNSLGDQRDRRATLARVEAAMPVVALLVAQMGHDPDEAGSAAKGMATVLYTGIERVVTVATDPIMPTLFPGEFAPNVRSFLRSEARLLEVGIRELRLAGVAAG